MRISLFLIMLIAWEALGQSPHEGSVPMSLKPCRISGEVEFRGAPITAVADFLGRLERKPVLLNWEADCRVRAFIGRDLSCDEAIPRIEAAIESNGCHVVDVASYIKIAPRPDDSLAKEVPHVLITIQHGRAAVDGTAVAVERISEQVRSSCKAEEEIWIQDLDYTYPSLEATSTNLNTRTVVSMLHEIDAKRIFRAYLPRMRESTQQSHENGKQ